MENKNFTENDIYMLKFESRLNDGTIAHDDLIIIGERNAHKHFDVVREANENLLWLALYKCKMLKRGFLGCVVDDGDPIREWKANEKEA